MLINETHKNYALMGLTALILILLFLLFKKENQVIPPEDNNGDITDIIIGNEPLPIPDIFKNFLKSKGVTGLTVGFKNGEVSLVSVDGQFINPCISNAKASSGKQTEYKEALHSPNNPCRFEGGLKETHAFIAKRSGAIISACDRCIGADNVSHGCNMSTNKYGCYTNRQWCSGSTCGD